VPTLSFRLLCGFLILRHHRRRIMWLGVTENPTAELIAQQLTEACGWEAAPDYIVRDRDCAYGEAYVRRLRAMGVRDRPTAPQSPWQNAYAERLIGSIRWEVLDHIVVLAERYLRHVLLSYMTYYNEARTHLSLDKDRRFRAKFKVYRPDLRQTSFRRTASPIRSDLIRDRDRTFSAAVTLVVALFDCRIRPQAAACDIHDGMRGRRIEPR
jgi:transposase InsO family protein